MNENIGLKMKNSARIFKRNAAAGNEEWLSDNFYILERHAVQAASECKKVKKLLKGSDLLPGLFMRCRDMCEKGVLPDEKRIIEYFGKSGLSGIAAGYLPLSVTCALIDIAAEGAQMKNKKGTGYIANSVTSLRRMAETDFDFITEKLCVSERILCRDPSGIYSDMDRESKGEYRRLVAIGAKSRGISEREFAQQALEKAEKNSEHIGKYIVNKQKSRRGMLFLIFEIIMPLATSAALSVLFKNIWVGILLFFPLWELMRYPIESVSVKGVLPKRFFRLSADCERVTQTYAFITVSVLMPSADKMNELENKLEQIYLSNCIGNIKVCCLADFKAADMPKKPEDKNMIKAAKDTVNRLNQKYAGGFVFAVRPRVYSKTQGNFIGRERKRGAITELIRAIKGNSKGFVEIFGDTNEISKVRYLIALDADTQLVFDSARELIAIAEHPLNKPVIRNGRVVDGYGILVPKATNRLNDEKATLFARIMAGDTGVSSYNSLSVEKYQDLFGEGIFCGKGLIDIDAFYKTLDKSLPNETVLSHDIVEGGYLRAGYVSDVQITESFPPNAASYYQRMNRWVRGDWQNIKFIFEKNPLNFISRYKMFDNLRRSMVSVCCLAAVVGSLVFQGYAGVFTAAAAIAAIGAGNLFSGVNSLINSGFSALSRLYFSKALPAALGCFARAFVSVAYSAREGFVCVSAALTALWRLFVSRKKLLEWTTAAQSEKTNSRTELVLSFVPSVLVGAAFVFGGLPIHRLMGFIIFADIPLTLFSKKNDVEKSFKITEKQRDSMISYAAAMWGFFDELCGKSNNFLPPDNIQFSPSRAVANRTSPTNIGLMLISFLSARDFGFITSAELYMRLNLSLSTVEKLEKYKGNLLNWYDTVTLEPLEPRFVSAVDSGNLLCCLTALKEGLREYLNECTALENIIERAEKIIKETDLAVMYNENRKLFHIGISPEDGQKSESFYDLYMSEMRMTAYYAVARRIVSKKHWGTMGRILVGQGRYTGLVSWTGTMFEYFMPNLFIPAPKGSLSAESLMFCLHCQRKRAGKRPFGISESGFYAFDGALNYQYKAHGVQKLGLRRGLDKEYVVSPYSSFLTLTTAPVSSMKNLLRLERMGLVGKYGFYEAVDFTKGRNSGEYSVIRSFMAHHIGMSFVALDNFLNKECIQKRFMSDVFMKGAKSLLDESVQTGARVFNDIKVEEKHHIREKTQSKNIVSAYPSPFSHKATIFSNGRMTTCITDCGTGVTLFDGLDVTVSSEDLFFRPQGVFAVFVTEKEKISFVRAVNYSADGSFTAEFQKNKAVFMSNRGNIRLCMEVFLLKHHNCEIRRFTVENLGNKENLKGKLIVYFDPCLEKREEYSSHAAFSKLFLRDEWDEENKSCIFFRNSRNEQTTCAVAAGFIENITVKHERNREKVLKTPKGVFSIGEKTLFEGSRGNPDCCCAFSVDIEVESKEKKVINFAVAAEENKEQALNTLLTVRAIKKLSRAADPFYSDSLNSAVSSAALPEILYPKLAIKGSKEGDKCIFSKRDLWSFGISGDFPIVLLEIESEEQSECIVPYVKLNKILRSCGIMTDLVICCNKKEGYISPILSSVKAILLKEDCGLMEGVRGGIHIVNLSSHSYEQSVALHSYAVHTVSQKDKEQKEEKSMFRPLKTVVEGLEKSSEKNMKPVKCYNFTECEIAVSKKPSSVDIPWCMVFANKSFGTMVSDKSLGFTWAINSRQNKLTPWYNDTMTDNRGEILFVKYNGVLYDVAALGKSKFTPDRAVWAAHIGGVEIAAEISVPERGMSKKCHVEISNKSGSVRTLDLLYFTLPVLGVDRAHSLNFFVRKTDNSVVCRCSDSEIKGYSVLSCSEPPNYFCTSVKDFFEGHFSSGSEEIPADCCVSLGRKISLAAGGKTSLNFYLSWGATEKAAVEMPNCSDFGIRLLNPLKINTFNENMNLLFNSFLYSQIKQSRFYARTGFYQCSGAYGFRDQLQDSLAFIDFEPKLTLTHIFRCAAVQFVEGDVLHWWHVTVNRFQIIHGVRTKCSDDMLWLPYVCAIYRRKTGDSSFFETKIPYISAECLRKNERERYISPERTSFKETLLNHCIKAVDYSLKFGKNGLPLMGSCDWNDGFSRMEDSESVWLAMFQKIVLDEMCEICDEFGMKEKSTEYKSISKKTAQALEEKSWMENRYARAILCNGEKLGADNDFIDILPQAFAVFADIGTEDNQNIALTTAVNYLFDEKSGVIRLFSPPFEPEKSHNIGYIASYPAGIRENSGQYTHAAVWLAMALIKKGRAEEGKKILSAINPLSFYSDEASAKRYRAEPYVLAGDVSYGEGIIARAGWTHFTGSAAWYYRCIAENQSLFMSEISKSKNKNEKSSCKADFLNNNSKI